MLHGRDLVLAHPVLARAPAIGKPDKPIPKVGEIADPILAAIWQPTAEEDAHSIAELVGSFSGHVVNVSGTSYVFAYREVTGYADRPWLIGRYFPLAELETEVRRLREASWIALAVLAFTMAIAWWFGRAIGEPIRHLARATDAIRRFAFDAVQPLPPSRLAEVDEAARAYNALIAAAHWFETYVPRRLVQRLMAQGAAAAAQESRNVTVMFTDIAGFTALAERLSAAETAAFLNQHFALVASCVEAEAGTIDKFIGDAVMAFWGAPEQQPDHAGRACRAALAIARAVAMDNAARAASGLERVTVRIGVHTGPAVVGNIGAPGRMNYTVVGDTVNIAQRLEALAAEYASDPGGSVALASGATVEATQNGQAFQPVGTHRLRGRDHPIAIYRLV